MTIELGTVLDLLRDHGYRITPQRTDVVKCILNNGSHPSAEDIHRMIRKRYPMVSLATVYKTLDLLKRLYVIQELGFSDRSTRYETNDNSHINMVCIKCGRINDVVGILGLSELELQARDRSSYLILSRRFELHGYCPSCKARIKPTN